MSKNSSHEEYNAYMREYMLTRYHRRRAAAIEYLGGGCAICGVTKDLEFDHKDPSTKSFTIAKLSSANELVFWQEVEKCQLLCKVHHHSKSAKETRRRRCGSDELPHGAWKYQKDRCRCDVCRTKVKEHRDRYRAKKRQ